MDKYTLLIIDMQPDFEASNEDWLINEICNEIEHAKKQGCPIIVLEYMDYGETHPEIMETIGNYDKFFMDEKDDDDGSHEVATICNTYDLPTRFIVCGINYSACVQRTVHGMVQRQDYDPSNISVLYSACNDPEDWQYEHRTHQHLDDLGVEIVME